MRTILLNPGPVTLSARVRAALTGPDLCHREVEFLDLQDRLRHKLGAVYGLDDATWGTVLLTGSGTAAVEAMVASCVPRDGRLLVVENGVYGERMRRIAAAYGIDCDSLHAAWGESIDLAALRAMLAGQRYSHVAVVHHETTTGRLNDLAAVAAACVEHGAKLLLDAVSSFGAEAIDFATWPIDGCAATANKCLHGVPGTAFVIARRAALAALTQPRTVYLDLAEYLARQDGRGTPFTQSVQTFYALDAALDEFFEAGGWHARQALFRQRMAAIRARLESLGVRPLLPAGESSCVLEAYELPEGRTYAELHAALKERGFIIYAGQGALSARVFRVSAMGDIGADDLERLLDALGDILG
ncbi:MAG: 2-aminoethylphosphonate aminotransferase [Gammaproteobacteria bacterium]